MTTTVTGKHQVTIPAKLARQMDIEAGTQLDWSVGPDGTLIVRPMPRRGELARCLCGMGRTWVNPGTDPVGDLIREREIEEQESPGS